MRFACQPPQPTSNKGLKQRLLLQHAARQLGQQLLDEAAEAGVPPMAYAPADAQGGPVLPKVLDLTVQLLKQGYLEQGEQHAVPAPPRSTPAAAPGRVNRWLVCKQTAADPPAALPAALP